MWFGNPIRIEEAERVVVRGNVVQQCARVRCGEYFHMEVLNAEPTRLDPT
jgi:hypothetical protein